MQWKQHLLELLQVYNSTRSVVTCYSLHYLMFGRCPHLPVDFYFLTQGTHVHSCHVPTYVEEVRRHFNEAYIEAHLQTNSDALVIHTLYTLLCCTFKHFCSLLLIKSCHVLSDFSGILHIHTFNVHVS